MKSISIKSFFLSPLNLLHGDVGILNEKDILIIFSKSGKTKEIDQFLPIIKERKIFVSEICCENVISKKEVNHVIKLPLKSEISGELNTIPSNSIISYIFFINILISELKKSISLVEYKKNHPFGNIGNNMKKVSEVIINLKDCCILDKNKHLRDGIITMNLKKMGIILITEKEEIYGIITDRDIRNYIEFNEIITIELDILANKKFFYIEDLNMRLKDIDEEYDYIPVVKNNKFLGLVKM